MSTSNLTPPSTQHVGSDLRGIDTGQDISVIIVDTDDDGAGPELHQHPYPETFVLITGSVHFWVGDDDFIAHGPSLQVAPAHTPHRFATVGGGVRMVNIHANPTFLTEWL